MKKFTKGMLIAAGIFGAVGIGLTAAGGVMGASMSELTGVESLKRVLLVADGDYDYDDSDDYDDDDDYDDSDDYDSDDYDDSDDCDDSEDYACAVDENEEDGTVYQLKYQPTKLDIELKYDDLILEEGDSFCVRVYDDSGKNVTVKESSDTLKVRRSSMHWEVYRPMKAGWNSGRQRENSPGNRILPVKTMPCRSFTGM